MANRCGACMMLREEQRGGGMAVAVCRMGDQCYI